MSESVFLCLYEDPLIRESWLLVNRNTGDYKGIRVQQLNAQNTM